MNRIYLPCTSKNSTEENISQEFRSIKIDQTRTYFIKKQNKKI